MEKRFVEPTPAQLKARRSRSVALALALGAFVILVYVGSLAKLGSSLSSGRCERMKRPERAPWQAPRPGGRNRNAALLCLGLVGGMLGMAYAAVPLYQLFCQVTGYGGTTQRVSQYSETILDRRVTVRFDANTNGVPWDFQPAQRSVSIRIGETAQVHYVARNLSSRPAGGTATFNVSPPRAGAYFNKVECFCFTEQVLQPGESYDMPVVFFVDPEIVNVPELKDLSAITLSYTFFPLETKAPLATAPSINPDPNQNLGG